MKEARQVTSSASPVIDGAAKKTPSTWSVILVSHHLPILVALVGVVLALPSLGGGFVLDDYLLHAQRSSNPQFDFVSAPSHDLFSFFSGDAQRTRQLMDRGYAPWWTLPDLRSAWWRPLASLSHSLDFALWPNSPWLMHLHNVFWWGVLALTIGYFYRQFMGASWVAGLAALLYVIDDARGMPVGFIANRNALFATLFGVLSLMAHDRWRRKAPRTGPLRALFWFGLSLLSAEAGLSTTAYLFSYAVFLDRGSRTRRLLSLMPYGALVVVWRIVWMQLGYGIWGNGLYIDPAHDPLRFLIAATVRGPVLLLGQFGLPPSDTSVLFGGTGVAILAGLAIVFLVIVAVVAWPVFRVNRTAGFWGLGLLLSVIPICATGPSDRLLFFVGLGGSALVAMLLSAVFGPDRSTRALLTPWLRGLGFFCVAVHLVIAPIGFMLRAAWPMGPPSLAEPVEVRTPFDSTIERQDVVIVNAPFSVQACMLPVYRGLAGDPVPGRVRVLGPALGPVKIDRVDARSLIVAPEVGFFPFPFDQIFRGEDVPMHVGQVVEVQGMRAEVLAIGGDRRPIRVKFTFSEPLESARFRWLQWSDGHFVAFSPPALGQSVTLTANFKNMS